MSNIRIEDTKLQGVKHIFPFKVSDQRGKFTKIFERHEYEMQGIDFETSEIMFSASAKGVLRGLHFQTKYPQAKIVSVVKGRIYDVAVDLRQNSKTRGNWVGMYLSEENGEGLYIPEGFAHGFLSLQDDTVVLYQCKNTYLKEEDTGILWNDATLQIQWPLHESGQLIVSQRDQSFDSYLEFFNRCGGL